MWLKKMTAKQFLQNPTGKGSATVARRDRIRRDMANRFDELYKNSKRKFDLRVTRYKDNYYFIFKIPSEFYHSVNLRYDVVIEFSPPDEQRKKSSSLDSYNIRFYSNSPNFMFTYGYIYNQDGMLIPWLKKKISDKALIEPPEVRNPREEYGFEKSVYFALLYLETNPRTMKKSSVVHSSIGLNQIASNIPTSNFKLKEYGVAKKKYDDIQKRKAKSIPQRIKRTVTRSNNRRRTIQKPGITKSSTSKTRKVKPVRATRKAKPTRRTR